MFSTSFDVPAGVQQVGAQFNFRKGTATSASNGIWIDDVKLNCYAQPGEEDSTSYAFLQGTSMAAPHVAACPTLLAADGADCNCDADAQCGPYLG